MSELEPIPSWLWLRVRVHPDLVAWQLPGVSIFKITFQDSPKTACSLICLKMYCQREQPICNHLDWSIICKSNPNMCGLTNSIDLWGKKWLSKFWQEVLAQQQRYRQMNTQTDVEFRLFNLTFIFLECGRKLKCHKNRVNTARKVGEPTQEGQSWDWTELWGRRPNHKAHYTALQYVYLWNTVCAQSGVVYFL